jgi:hypothetical protein
MANPFGNFQGKRDHMRLAGTNQDVMTEARNFGRTRTGALQTSTGRKATARNLGRGAGERLYGANGQINASSDKELIEKIGLLLEGAQGRERTGSDRLFERGPTDEYSRFAQLRTDAIRQAQADPDGRGFRILGEVLGDEVYETLGRQGFARQCLMVREFEEDETNRVKIRKKDVSALVSTTAINAPQQMMRQFYVYPGEYYIKGYVSVEEKELAQAGSEMLDDKFQDLLEQIMVQEDKIVKNRWDDQVGILNPGLTFNTFTPLLFSQGAISIDSYGLPCTRAVMAWDMWNDIRAEPEFESYFDPVHKHALILEGKIGSIMNVQLITDGFRYDTLRVLNDGEIYFLGPKVAVGVIGQRTSLQTRPTDRYNMGQAARGYFAFQIQSTVTFPRAVTRGRRIAA